jgi:RNA recognition motif-containing protein
MKTANRPSNTVYISNLSYKRDRFGVKALFNGLGHVQKVKVIVEPQTLQSRGMAFVELKSVQEATLAIQELDGLAIDGRTIKAKFAIPQREVPTEGKRKLEKDILFKETQLAKKKRNEERRKRNPLQFKAPAKKI